MFLQNNLPNWKDSLENPLLLELIVILVAKFFSKKN